MIGDKMSSHGTKRQTMRLWPEFAKAIGIGRNVAYQRAGKDFRVVRIGKRILVPRSEFERLVGAKRGSPNAARRTSLASTMMMMKSSLSALETRLLEIMQKMNYGRIEDLSIRCGQPMFNPPPRIVRDVKLGAPDNGARPELEASDFALKREHVELFESIRRLGDGTIEAIEIKAGLPFRLLIEERL